MGTFADVGIDDRFIKEVQTKVSPGTSALFLMSSGATTTRSQHPMRLYVFYVIAIASVVIASLATVPGLDERLRRWLIAAVAVLVLLPSAAYLIFGGG